MKCFSISLVKVNEHKSGHLLSYYALCTINNEYSYWNAIYRRFPECQQWMNRDENLIKYWTFSEYFMKTIKSKFQKKTLQTINKSMENRSFPIQSLLKRTIFDILLMQTCSYPVHLNFYLFFPCTFLFAWIKLQRNVELLSDLLFMWIWYFVCCSYAKT